MEDTKTLMVMVNKQHLSIHPTPSNEVSDKKEFICLWPMYAQLDLVFGQISRKSCGFCL